ncbi:dihydroorotate dehydrogenase electron transfer subunit [Chloroflexota bacterium]
MKQGFAPVISNDRVMPGCHLIWLEAPEIAAAAAPGQFVMVHCGEDTTLRRPLSIHQVDGDRLALLFTVVGKGTGWLSDIKKGEKLDIFGPLGNGFKIAEDSKKFLLVAGGMGIAPLAFLAERAANLGCEVKIHQGVYVDGEVSLEALRSHMTLVPRSAMPASATQYASAGTIECTASTATPSVFWPTGLAPTYCVQEGYAAWADQIFACGPLPMYQTMTEMPELKGKNVQVSLEMRMACGVNACYGCTIKTKNGLKQVCKDGPVFNMEDVIWDSVRM